MLKNILLTVVTLSVALVLIATNVSAQELFVAVPVVKQSRYTDFLGEVDSRLTSSALIYNLSDISAVTNKSLSIHESIHKLNAQLANRYPSCRVVYVMNGRAAVFYDPGSSNFSIPDSLRGGSYQTYMVKNAKANNYALGPLIDELTTYTNNVTIDIALGSKLDATSDLTHSIEIQNYCLVMLANLKTKGYQDPRLKALIGWNAYRVAELYLQAAKEGWLGNDSKVALYAIQSKSDTLWLRNFCIEAFGARWCNETLGISLSPSAPLARLSPTIVMLDFTATWCGPCKQMTPIIDRMIKAGRSVVKVDVDRQKDVARQYKISAIPAFVFLRSGQEIKRFVGVTSREELEAEFK